MILLISDLHLEEERPDITRAFLDFLTGRARSAQALYILGDFFEAWIGDDAMTPYQRSICEALRTLSDTGTKIFLMHGDSLCTRDEAYMRLRRYLRNPITLWVLRHLPLGTRHKLARKLRSESRAQTRMKANDIVDVTAEEIPRIMAHFGVHTLIHGHTHRPAIHKLLVNEHAAKRIVLGDWDRQGWVLQVDEQGMQLAPFDFAPPPSQ